MNPYAACPVFENNNYLLRLVETSDVPELLRVYADERAVPLFNSDNCHGDDFHYTTLKRMQEAMDFWLEAYRNNWFVRWAIIDQKKSETVGTIELFNRQAKDYFNNCGLLRLDLRSDYETAQAIYEILSLIIPQTYEMFDCRMIAAKVPPFAAERKAAVEKLGFAASSEDLIGDDGTHYADYYVMTQS